jgi:D-glycero-D-manno-heptose 1,7-bisphosphate phosphatase
MMIEKAAVFVDRDGVLNHVVPDPLTGLGESPLSVAEVTIVVGAGAEIARLRKAGWFVGCVTNQPAAAKGSIPLETVWDIQRRVRSLLELEGGVLDADRVCIHHPDGTLRQLTGPCTCRKPSPGMLLDTAREHALNLSQSWIIGDTDTDIEAGRAAGVRTILVTTEATRHKRSGVVKADIVVPNFSEAVARILGCGQQ